MPVPKTTSRSRSSPGVSLADELGTYRRAVRQHCMDCSGGELKSADQCPIKHCALYPLRPRSPKRKEKANV